MLLRSGHKGIYSSLGADPGRRDDNIQAQSRYSIVQVPVEYMPSLVLSVHTLAATNV